MGQNETHFSVDFYKTVINQHMVDAEDFFIKALVVLLEKFLGLRQMSHRGWNFFVFLPYSHNKLHNNFFFYENKNT